MENKVRDGASRDGSHNNSGGNEDAMDFMRRKGLVPLNEINSGHRADTSAQNNQRPRWPEVESEAAITLHCRIGQVRCVGDDWFVNTKGVWLPTERDMYRPIALDVLPKDYRTQARSVEVIKRLESEPQVTRDPL
jgi:hypothetical protein